MGQAQLNDRQRLYLTADEAAVKLGVTKRTLEKWRINGIGPKYITVGEKKIGYREQDLIDYLNSNVQHPSVNPDSKP